MKFTTALLAMASTAAALPSMKAAVTPRQSDNEITDELLFNITLPEFQARRGTPSTLNWKTDGCTSAPDNPFGFPFRPACERHDFGYHNYRDQSRFIVSAKSKIDKKSKKDLYYQCKGTSAKLVCKGLAAVYYAAVRAFGGDDAGPGKRDVDWVAIYEEKVAIYEALVRDAQAQGLLPILGATAE
ncbi:prokaryotic phospholipase A2-domain-containing protein [Emericellopsis atlantica]|uniref:Prokaryotic phospholipase A2-domain-containing protein n=1 Tax=Emericellopsis atlantica TaxID=2614577 RepID=A0A9P8CTG3_9HYPO|nr:prokaryotic phospholipase A2-domain-containing protein [Emericellopsis atlantica]KAG9258808.1 prokaryotic phospholipase A2-domain-containing protein [Emericellopsis atlantica]